MCLYCGLQSAVTNPGSVGECVDALQREVARLRDHLREGTRVSPSLPNMHRFGTLEERPWLGSVASEDRSCQRATLVAFDADLSGYVNSRHNLFRL